jgi:hypothetical protein
MMKQFVADVDLLFGILALQMDFITRDELVDAMGAWLLRKDHALGEILEARGVLSPSDRGLLEPLVRRHIEQHGGDPARSLASISSVDWIRQGLSAAGRADPDLGRSLGHLRPLSTESVAASGGATAPHAGRVDGPGGRFRIIRFHARGGLGEV